MSLINPIAFDALAEAYDDDFTRSLLGQLLRPRVWDILARHFTAGQHILELACGTGEDAAWLARQGIHITATDGSVEMIKKAKAKAEEQRTASAERQAGGAGETNVLGRIEVEQVSLQQVAGGYFGGPPPALSLSNGSAVGGRLFDGVFSNFGGLNTIGEWRGLAAALAEIVKPGGVVILVPMGPICPWEIFWYLVHGQPKTALRRFARQGAPAKIGGSVIPIWYPSAWRLQADFAPWFRHQRTESLGLWLPPSYLDHWVNTWPALFRWLNRLEKVTARFSGGWGDHYVTVFERINN
ncbi:MAG: class I SAM-dependent methyltransferase [Anaerolineales bacterium]|nr:class I SAM-dependent methyltransferase [Anaerolineales bacterium]